MLTTELGCLRNALMLPNVLVKIIHHPAFYQEAFTVEWKTTVTAVCLLISCIDETVFH